MKPPYPYKVNPKRGYSLCMACVKWRLSNSIFHHDGVDLILCRDDFEDYWENTEELLPDFKRYM